MTGVDVAVPMPPVHPPGAVPWDSSTGWSGQVAPGSIRPTDAGGRRWGAVAPPGRRGGGTLATGRRPFGEADAWSPAFVELYRERYAAMVRLAFLLTSEHGAAEELVQDAFVRIAHRLDRIDNPAAYLRTTVVNACRSHHRRRRLERLLPRQRDDHVDPPETDDIWPLLHRLPDRQRTALVLRYYEDLTIDQIADAMQTRPGTVKSLVHRGIAKLRTAVTP